MRVKIRKTDILFSKYIRSRDNWTCNRCKHKHEVGSRGLHNSHYWSRGKESVRFEEDNCIALCFACHRLWGHGDEREQYREFMIKKLGEEGFKGLMMQANTFKKRDDIMDEIIITQLLDNLNGNKNMNKSVEKIINIEVRKKEIKKRQLEFELKRITKEIEDLKEGLK